MFDWIKNKMESGKQAPAGGDHKQRGNALLDQGQWEQAAACYRQAIAITPNDIDAYINLGFALLEQQQIGEAQESLQQALKLDPGSADALYMLGGIARGQGKWSEAIERWSRLLKLKPDFEMAYRDLCQALFQNGQVEQAREVILQGLQHYPQTADFHYYLGNLQAHAQQHEQAAKSFMQALEIAPDFYDALVSCGNALAGLRRFDQALLHYDRALRLHPDNAQVLSNRGRVLQGLDRLDEALANYDRALNLKPDFPEALFNRASVLDCLGRHEDALACIELLLRDQPNDIDAIRNRANILRTLNRIEEALAGYERALQLDAGSADTWANRGVALADLNRYQQALESYAAALRLQPAHPVAQFNESLTRLLLGDFATGWKNYESRWHAGVPGKQTRHFAQPQWLGNQALQGKTILLHAEQGLGDSIQFGRYAKFLAGKGATVLLEVQPALRALLGGLSGVHKVFVMGEPLPPFDYHCPLLSLPLAFQTGLSSIPAQDSYLGSDPARAGTWSARLGEKSGPRVGLIWSGNAIHKNDRNRSIRFSEFAGLMVNGIQYVSLQKEVRAEDKTALDACGRVAQFGDELTDFSDTAALISQLDLVISVDTSVAHLAGAMGKPVWLLLPSNPDWRWLLERSDSPWYPSMKLFRQSKIGDWRSVIQAVAQESESWRREAAGSRADV